MIFKEKVNEYSIKSICDGAILAYMHPRTAINIVLQEIEEDGSIGNQLACAINSVCMALLDANIPMKYNFASIHCSMLKEDQNEGDNNNRIVYFPTAKQERNSSLIITFVFDSIDNDVMFVNTSGIFDQENFDLMLKGAQKYANEKLFVFFNKQIKKKYSLHLEE